MNPIQAAWRSLPPRGRSIHGNVVKLFVTIGAFYLLLTHKIDGGEGVGKHPDLPCHRRLHGPRRSSSTFFFWLRGRHGGQIRRRDLVGMGLVAAAQGARARIPVLAADHDGVF